MSDSACPYGCVDGVLTDSDLGGEGTSSYCPRHDTYLRARVDECCTAIARGDASEAIAQILWAVIEGRLVALDDLNQALQAHRAELRAELTRVRALKMDDKDAEMLRAEARSVAAENERLLERVEGLEGAIRRHLAAEYESTPEDAIVTWREDAPVVRLARALTPTPEQEERDG